MLSYRHSFHAGNHADVLKHIVLMLILENLKQKDKGFYYLDTHAGTGHYRLFSAESEKTAEFVEGIGRLWDRTDLPDEVQRYIELIKKLNYGGKELRYYAGSPLIAAQLLRPQDRALLTELHPADYPLLRNNFKEYHNVVTKRDNGFQQLKATLPPKERRGLVISKGLEATGIRKILQIELAVRPDSDQRGMTASGMIVINPPWQLENQMKTILPYLTRTLVPEGTGSWKVSWITPE